MSARELRAWLLGVCVLACGACGNDAAPPPASPAPVASPAAEAAPPAARPPADQAGTLLISDAAGQTAWTLRLDGNHVEVAGSGVGRLVGDQRGDKRRYRRESDGAVVAEVKSSDSGFKLRTPDGQLLWKVKLSEDKIKISNNEENDRPYVLKTGYADKAKVLDASEAELGNVRFQPERIKLKAADGSERFHMDSTRRSAALGVLLMEAIPQEQRGILMVELLGRNR